MGKKTFKKELGILVDYVKEHTQENEWVNIKYRDIPAMTGVSSYYTKKMLEMLKSHSNILFEVDRDHKSNKKPLKFKYVSEEEKLNTAITSDSFYYLHEPEVEKIKGLFDSETYQERLKIFNTVNYLASLGAKEKYVDITIGQLSDIMVETKTKMSEIVNKLVNMGILVDRNGQFALLLNSDTNTGHKHDESLINHGSFGNESGHTGNEALAKDLSESNDLVENMQQFYSAITGLQSEFSSFLKGEVDHILNREEEKRKLEKDYQAFHSLLEENEVLKNKNKALQEEVGMLRDKYNKSESFYGTFVDKAQERMEMFVAEVINITTDYSKVPAWKRDEKTSARMQKNILDAVTSTVNDLLNVSKN